MIYKEDLEKIREAKKKDGTLFLVKKIPNSIYWRSRNRLVGARLSKRQTRLYNSWIKKYELSEFKELKYKPKLSVLVPVYNVKSVWLNKCIESVLSQNYENWELCLYDDASTMAETIQTLHEWEGRDERIKISFGKVNQHISGASNRCLAMATGDFVALLDNDDELTQNALYEAAKVLNDNLALDFIYSDEDKIDEEGTRKDPYFKPDWAPELFLSQMYTCHLGVYRRSIMEKINGFRVGYEGSQDYDLVLRFIEQTNPQKICHIPKILYHWRTLKTSTASSGKAKTYTLDAGRKTLTNYLERNKIQGKVELGLSSNTYHVINNI
ncbi:MAG: glycosyltransferase, partial [bacterium]